MTIKLYELCGANEELVFSPHCWKTRMSLAHKGLDFDSVPLPFTKVATIENGDSRRVPVIRDGETVVEDSLEIAKYLDAQYPDTPRLLEGAAADAMTNLLINWAQTQVHPVVVKMCLMDIYNALAPEDQVFFRATREKVFGMSLEDFASKMASTPEDLAKVLVPLELTLKKQPFICGETPMFADYAVFGALQWLRITKGDTALPKEGEVSNWFNRLLDVYDGMARNTVIAA